MLIHTFVKQRYEFILSSETVHTKRYTVIHFHMLFHTFVKQRYEFILSSERIHTSCWYNCPAIHTKKEGVHTFYV